MKKILLLAIAAMFAQVAVAQNVTDNRKKAEKDNILYIIDGKVVSKDAFKAVPPEDVQNIDVYKGVAGAMVMSTKKGDALVGKVVKVNIPSGMDPDTVKQMNNVIRIMARGAEDKKFTEVDPLVVVKVSEGNIKVMENVKDIDPNTIKVVTVFKDGKKTEEFKKYGDVSKGVIFVELK